LLGGWQQVPDVAPPSLRQNHHPVFSIRDTNSENLKYPNLFGIQELGCSSFTLVMYVGEKCMLAKITCVSETLSANMQLLEPHGFVKNMLVR